MEMVRSFLPVGQGAFYTEQFDDGTTVIYDCGSEWMKRLHRVRMALLVSTLM